MQWQCDCVALETGEKIDGRAVAELPLTEDVIQRVEALGQAQRQATFPSVSHAAV